LEKTDNETLDRSRDHYRSCILSSNGAGLELSAGDISTAAYDAKIQRYEDSVTPKIEVREIDSKTHGLFINDRLIGTSKLNCDAMMQKHFLDELFSDTYRAGIDSVYERL
jgi:hypothetical protein